MTTTVPTPITPSLDRRATMGEPAPDDDMTPRAELRPVINAPEPDQGVPVASEPLNPLTGPNPDRPIAWLVGVHGGAGVSTLATMLAPFWDAGGTIPAADDPSTVILVAATHKSGLRKLHDAVLQFAAGNAGSAELLGVVIVDQAPGKLSKNLDAEVQRITEATPSHNVWRIAYTPAWREARPVELPSWPRDDDAATGGEKLSRKQRKERSDPLRWVPESVAETATDMFNRAHALYQRLNKP